MHLTMIPIKQSPGFVPGVEPSFQNPMKKDFTPTFTHFSPPATAPPAFAPVSSQPRQDWNTSRQGSK